MFKKNDAEKTCSREKKTNLLDIDLLHNIATGTFNNNIPSDVEKVRPKKVLVIFSIRMATPVKPEASKFIGRIKTSMTVACR